MSPALAVFSPTLLSRPANCPVFPRLVQYVLDMSRSTANAFSVTSIAPTLRDGHAYTHMNSDHTVSQPMPAQITIPPLLSGVPSFAVGTAPHSRPGTALHIPLGHAAVQTAPDRGTSARHRSAMPAPSYRPSANPSPNPPSTQRSRHAPPAPGGTFSARDHNVTAARFPDQNSVGAFQHSSFEGSRTYGFLTFPACSRPWPRRSSCISSRSFSTPRTRGAVPRIPHLLSHQPDVTRPIPTDSGSRSVPHERCAVVVGFRPQTVIRQRFSLDPLWQGNHRGRCFVHR